MVVGWHFKFAKSTLLKNEKGPPKRAFGEAKSVGIRICPALRRVLVGLRP